MIHKIEEFANITSPSIIIVAVFLVVIEWSVLLLSNKTVKNKEGLVSVISAALTHLPRFAVNKFLCLSLMFLFYNFRLFDLGFSWYVWILGWLAYDFLFWFFHFLDHKVRLLWCFHSVHHTPKEMKFSVAFRGSVLDFLKTPHNIIWLPLIGFNPFLILIIDTVGSFYGILVHVNEKWLANSKYSLIDKLLVTPTSHRIHHAVNELYIDRNYGETFSVWDHLFGTFQDYIKSEEPKYGVMKDDIDSEDLWDSQTSEWKKLWRDIKSADKFFDKLKYIFMPPGWNHLDGGLLANEIRIKALKKLNH